VTYQGYMINIGCQYRTFYTINIDNLKVIIEFLMPSI